MKDMKKYRNNTRTSANLERALSDEALSHVKYTVWGDEAERMGYPQIAHSYRAAANNELAHAKLWMEELGLSRSTNENLQNAIAAEEAGNRNYLAFASDAENEGYDVLCNRFLNVAQVEKDHMDGFSEMHRRLMEEELLMNEDCSTNWRCFNCGYSETGETPPVHCPLCGRPETWFVSE